MKMKCFDHRILFELARFSCIHGLKYQSRPWLILAHGIFYVCQYTYISCTNSWLNSMYEAYHPLLIKIKNIGYIFFIRWVMHHIGTLCKCENFRDFLIKKKHLPQAKWVMVEWKGIWFFFVQKVVHHLTNAKFYETFLEGLFYKFNYQIEGFLSNPNSDIKIMFSFTYVNYGGWEPMFVINVENLHI